jgi:hypothetical protein
MPFCVRSTSFCVLSMRVRVLSMPFCALSMRVLALSIPFCVLSMPTCVRLMPICALLDISKPVIYKKHVFSKKINCHSMANQLFLNKKKELLQTTIILFIKKWINIIPNISPFIPICLAHLLTCGRTKQTMMRLSKQF